MLGQDPGRGLEAAVLRLGRRRPDPRRADRDRALGQRALCTPQPHLVRGELADHRDLPVTEIAQVRAGQVTGLAVVEGHHRGRGRDGGLGSAQHERKAQLPDQIEMAADVAVVEQDQPVDVAPLEGHQLPRSTVRVAVRRTQGDAVAVGLQAALEAGDQLGVERVRQRRHDQADHHRLPGGQTAGEQARRVAEVGDRLLDPGPGVRLDHRALVDDVRHRLLGDSGPERDVLDRDHWQLQSMTGPMIGHRDLEQQDSNDRIGPKFSIGDGLLTGPRPPGKVMAAAPPPPQESPWSTRS
jgi:hypothetical protein